jgi:hypothetical protein
MLAVNRQERSLSLLLQFCVIVVKFMQGYKQDIHQTRRVSVAYSLRTEETGVEFNLKIVCNAYYLTTIYQLHHLFSFEWWEWTIAFGELERTGEKMVVAYFNMGSQAYCPVILLNGLTATVKNPRIFGVHPRFEPSAFWIQDKLHRSVRHARRILYFRITTLTRIFVKNSLNYISLSSLHMFVKSSHKASVHAAGLVWEERRGNC